MDTDSDSGGSSRRSSSSSSGAAAASHPALSAAASAAAASSAAAAATSAQALLSLPWHVLQHRILPLLDNRSLAAFARTCSAARDAVRHSLTPAHRSTRRAAAAIHAAFTQQGQQGPHQRPPAQAAPPRSVLSLSLSEAYRRVGWWALVLATQGLVDACERAEKRMGGAVALAAAHADGGCRRLLLRVLLPDLVRRGGDALALACMLACRPAAPLALVRAAVHAARAAVAPAQAQAQAQAAAGAQQAKKTKTVVVQPRRRTAAKSRAAAPRLATVKAGGAGGAGGGPPQGEHDGEEPWRRREAAVLALYMLHREHVDTQNMPLPLPLPLPLDPIDVDMLRCVMAAADPPRTGWLLRLLPEAPLFKLGDVTNSAALATAVGMGRLDVLRAAVAAHRLSAHDLRTLCFPGLRRACLAGHYDVVAWLVEEWDLGRVELEQSQARAMALQGGHHALHQLVEAVLERDA